MFFKKHSFLFYVKENYLYKNSIDLVLLVKILGGTRKTMSGWKIKSDSRMTLRDILEKQKI